MSLSTPRNDDSESNKDQLGHSSLIQPQYTYHWFLTSLLAYSRAVYDFIQLPISGIEYANEISALSTVFPGLYPFETLNPTSFATRSPVKAEEPSRSALSVGEQDAVGPGRDTQSPNTPEAPTSSSSTPTSQAKLFHKASNTVIQICSFVRNSIAESWNEDKSILAIVAFICFCFFLMLLGVYHRSATADPSTNVFPVFPSRAEIHPTKGGDIMDGLGHLKKFVSFGAINGSYLHDPERQVHDGTRERALSQIKTWIDNPDATERILWLHGPAGVGKSAIAQTIVNSYTTEKIPASFLFFRPDPDRNDGNLLFTTLAWQILSSIPAIKPHIARSLIEQPDLPIKDVEIQFQELIVRPFEALSNDARPPEMSDMVVVIDGVDECKDARVQERFLNVIGNGAMTIRAPLRFLVISRPEDHIQETIVRFERHTLFIDLVEYADVDRDIKKYLKDQFANIAMNQHIDPLTWPGQEIIDQLVFKASGQFIYASTVIGFVGNKDNRAKARLDIILGLQPPTTTQPFAALDRLYIEILEQQSDQIFLDAFLPLLVARDWRRLRVPSSCIRPPPPSPRSRVRHTCEFLPFSCSYPRLRTGYGILMDMPEQVLHKKLRKMGSLLKITPSDDISLHPSFLEFLQNPSRSGQYNISTQDAVKQQLVLVIASVVRAAEQAFDQPNYQPPVPYEVETFNNLLPGYNAMLSGDDLREASRPLLKFQDRLLNLPNIVPRNECTIFHVVNYLLSELSYDWRRREKNVVIGVQNLLEAFSSLLTYFRWPKGMFDLMIILLFVKPETIAMKMNSWSEAQNLMDLTYLVVNGKYLPTSLWGKDVAQKAVQLAFEIHARVPVLPQFIYLAKYASSPYSVLLTCELEDFSQVLLISNFLDHRYILPVSRIEWHYCDAARSITIDCDENGSSINGWLESTDASHKFIPMLNLARTIQYLHSMGFVFSGEIRLDDIYVDSRFHVRISPTALVWSVHGHSLQEIGQRYEADINTFGSFFRMIYFGPESSYITSTPQAIRTCLSRYAPAPSVCEDVWRLIHRCLSAENKPSIDEVVQEMESWNV